jgi:3-(methylthio)propanoyl-CoA dehydrogenase
MNFFADNADLCFLFEHAAMDEGIRMFENEFRDHDLFDDAPADVADARDSYRRVLEIAGDIAARIIAPRCRAIDETPHRLENGRVIYSAPVQECLRALRQAELMGCTVSRAYGGLNLPNYVFTMLVEIISRAEAGLQNIFGLQGISGIIEAFAEEDLKKKYLPGFAQGSVTGAMALTEEEAGSDLQKVKLKAREQPDGTWRLSGVKRFITNGAAEVQLVLARSEPGTTDGLGLSLFVCEADASVSVRRLEEKLGIHGSPTCEVIYNNTPARLIGERQRGLVTYVLSLLNGARLATAAQAIGIAQAAFEDARAYARMRKQYDRRIEMLAPVAEMLVTMKVAIEGSRALTYETARIMDLSVGYERCMAAAGPEEKKRLRKEAKKYERLTMLLTSCAKYYCTEMSNRVTYDAMQVMGGSGYMRDYLIEKYYRDARITTIYEGTSQMQVVGAFRGILSGTMEKYFEELARAPFARPQAGLARRLERARKTLQSTVTRLGAVKSASRLDLSSRTLVDMATDILIGYLLLLQGGHSRRKLKIARMFIGDMELRLKLWAGTIRKADTSCVDCFLDIVGPAV